MAAPEAAIQGNTMKFAEWRWMAGSSPAME
jgi:hypothetical protein